MGFKLLLLVFLIKIVVAIRLEVNIDEKRNVRVSYEGTETSIVTDKDIAAFNLWDNNIKRAVEQYFGKWPADAFVRSPTPWGDLYKTYYWEPVKRVMSVKSAKVTNIKTVPVIVMTHDTENPSNQTIKVNTGLSRKVENTLKTSWSKEKVFVVSQDIEYGINVAYAHVGGTTGFSLTTTLGETEEKTKVETIGTTSNLEVELKPGAAIRSVLTASAGYVEIEVVHSATLTGHVALNYNPPYRGHHFHRIPIEDLQNYGGIKKEITMIETIRMECYGEAKLRVSDLETAENVYKKKFDEVHKKIVGKVHKKTVGKVHKKTFGKFHKKTVEKVHNKTVEKVHKKTVGKVHNKTVEKFHKKTVEKVHNKTVENVHKKTVGKVHKKTVDVTMLIGLFTKFDYMNMILMVFCKSCKNCLALCDDFGDLLRLYSS